MTRQITDYPGGLSDADVADWYRRLERGAGGALRATMRRLSGRAGMLGCGPDVLVDAEDPDGFELLLHVRQQALLRSFACLTTPMRVRRTPDLIRREPSDDLVVTVLWGRGRQRVSGGERECSYGPGRLAIRSNSSPYAMVSDGVSDPLGVIIPLEALGKDRRLVSTALFPFSGDSLLARATASFIGSFVLQSLVSSADESTQATVIDLVTQTLREAATGSPAIDTLLLQRQSADELIERNFWNADFDVENLAREMHVSRRQLYRLFDDGETPAAVIAVRRVQEARRLLRESPQLSVTAVGRLVGFVSEAAFRRRFHDICGVSPAAYRRAGFVEPAAVPLRPELAQGPAGGAATAG